jgi:hypothetical protein
MPVAFEVEARYSRIRLKLEELPDEVRSELKATTQVLADELLDVAEALAESELKVHTGNYLKGFRRTVRASKNSVTGVVRNRSRVGHLVEYGADRPAHEILPDTKRALAFMGGSAGQVFAARVQAPASHMPEYRILHRALADEKGTIVSELSGAVRDAAARVTE